MVQRIAVPQSVGDEQLLDRVDYADTFTVRTTAEHTAEEWLAIMFAHAHPAVLRLVKLAHGRVGRMNLATPDRDHPLGWTILEKSPDRLVLGVEGGIVTPRIVAASEPGRL